MKRQSGKAEESKAVETGDTSLMSVRVPRDIYRKIEKVAEAAQISTSDAAIIFLQKGVSATSRRRLKSA